MENNGWGHTGPCQLNCTCVVAKVRITDPINFEDFKFKIESCFHKWIINDPYPELTHWQMEEDLLGVIGRSPIFRWLHSTSPKPEIHHIKRGETVLILQNN